jgi:hypothetical protein
MSWKISDWEASPMDPSQFFEDPAFGFDVNMADLLDFSGVLPPISDVLPEPKAQPTNPNQLAKRTTRIRASKACVSCRSRHMKCDSKEPKCSKCETDGKECVYLKSRRGGSSMKASIPKDVQAYQDSSASTPDLSTGEHSTAPSESIYFPDTIDGSCCGVQQRPALLTAYFDFFHEAHPIVIPHRHLISLLQSDPSSFEYLTPVLEYIGSVYLPNVPSLPYQQAAEEKLDTELPNTAITVQALLLFALARHCCDEFELADRYVDRAIDVALLIKMNVQSFATENGETSPVLEESCRRTWWTLYCIDALFAAINRYPAHRLQDVVSDVGLPCEDWEYESGVRTPCSASNIG